MPFPVAFPEVRISDLRFAFELLQLRRFNNAEFHFKNSNEAIIEIHTIESRLCECYYQKSGLMDFINIGSFRGLIFR